jgi:hypothetical protein
MVTIKTAAYLHNVTIYCLHHNIHTASALQTTMQLIVVCTENCKERVDT